MTLTQLFSLWRCAESTSGALWKLLGAGIIYVVGNKAICTWLTFQIEEVGCVWVGDTWARPIGRHFLQMKGWAEVEEAGGLLLIQGSGDSHIPLSLNENFVLPVLVDFGKRAERIKKDKKKIGQKEGYFSTVFLRTCGNTFTVPK